jgi:hypothetical protein
MRRIDGVKVGDQFGRWTVTAIDSGFADVKCACGKEARRRRHALVSGGSKSCGCAPSGKKVTHGERRRGSPHPPEYRAWTGMAGRCYNPLDKRFGYYGGRGITVCERWRGESGYANFLADLGRRPSPRHSIDRKEVNGNYEPGNCRWATPEQQMRNKRDNVNVTIDGRTMCLKEWSRERGLNYKMVHSRVRSGWPPEVAVAVRDVGRGGHGVLSLAKEVVALRARARELEAKVAALEAALPPEQRRVRPATEQLSLEASK